MSVFFKQPLLLAREWACMVSRNLECFSCHRISCFKKSASMLLTVGEECFMRSRTWWGAVEWLIQRKAKPCAVSGHKTTPECHKSCKAWLTSIKYLFLLPGWHQACEALKRLVLAARVLYESYWPFNITLVKIRGLVSGWCLWCWTGSNNKDMCNNFNWYCCYLAQGWPD